MKTITMVDVTRGNEVESRHHGVAVFIDSTGKVLKEWGDSNYSIFPRSSLKPIQSLNLYKNGIDQKLNITQPFLAFSTASHHGQNIHTEKAEAWLKQLGLNEESLACGEDWPANHDDKFNAQKIFKKKRKIFHNCSGKHCAHLAVAKVRDLSIQNYQDPNHPLQKELFSLIESLANKKIKSVGIDGCTLPNPFMNLKDFALISARFGDYDYLKEHGQTAKRIFDACVNYPELTGGTNSINCLLTKISKDIFFKNGAEGVYVAILPKIKSAIAVKIVDGTQRAAEVAIAGIINELGLISEEKLNPFIKKPVYNSVNTQVGEIKFHDQ